MSKSTETHTPIITIPPHEQQVLIHQTGDAMYQIQNQAQLTVVVIIRSGSQSITLDLVGEGAHGKIIGVGNLGEDNIAKIHTLQRHRARQTTSDLLVKTVLTGQAKFFYDGAIRVETSGQQTNAYQRNENLVLSTQAEVETKPSLEILADDVRCTHGATVGDIDPEQLFFLQSRGLDSLTAETLIQTGFLEQAYGQIEDDSMIQKIKEALWQDK